MVRLVAALVACAACQGGQPSQASHSGQGGQGAAGSTAPASTGSAGSAASAAAARPSAPDTAIGAAEPDARVKPDDLEAPDPGRAIAELSAIPAWQAVVDRTQLLGRRGQHGVVYGRVGPAIELAPMAVPPAPGSTALAIPAGSAAPAGAGARPAGSGAAAGAGAAAPERRAGSALAPGGALAPAPDAANATAARAQTMPAASAGGALARGTQTQAAPGMGSAPAPSAASPAHPGASPTPSAASPAPSAASPAHPGASPAPSAASSAPSAASPAPSTASPGPPTAIPGPPTASTPALDAGIAGSPYVWLIDDTEGNGALGIRIALGDRAKQGDRIAAGGAWQVDADRRWYWKPDSVQLLPPGPSGDLKEPPPAAPSHAIATGELPAGARAISAARDNDVAYFQIVGPAPASDGDGWQVADRPGSAPVIVMNLPGERASYGGIDMRAPDERWQLKRGQTYWVRIGKLHKRGDKPTTVNARTAPIRLP
jgi:hypothetical protein